MLKIYRRNILKLIIVTEICIVYISCTCNDGSSFINPTIEVGESTLPTMYIYMSERECQDIHTSQDKKVEVDCQIVSPNNDTIYCGTLNIKTRGNQSFTYEKKPYSIKFPHKVSLLNLYRSKSFVLLANWHDRSFIRNSVAFDLGVKLGIPSPRYTFVRLVINGDYYGLYQLTNRVEINKHYLNISNLESSNKEINFSSLKEYPIVDELSRKGKERKGFLLPTNPEDITGGYILDHHAPKKDDCGFVTDNSKTLIRIKAPKHASLEQVDYISGVYNDMESAVCNNVGYNPITGRYYTDYLDIESFARCYLVNEWLKNYDSGTGSFMLYKDEDSVSEKIYAGPLWDFDADAYEAPNNVLYACGRIGLDSCAVKGGLLYHLWNHRDFRQKVQEIYLNEMLPILENEFDDAYYDRLYYLLSEEVIYDNIKWHGQEESRDYKSQIDLQKQLLNERKDFLKWLWTSSEENMVCLHLTRTAPNLNRYRTEIVYCDKVVGIRLPSDPVLSNKSPHFKYYITGTQTEVPHDTVFYENTSVTQIKEYPSWMEVQKRRVKKKIRRIFSRV